MRMTAQVSEPCSDSFVNALYQETRCKDSSSTHSHRRIREHKRITENMVFPSLFCGRQESALPLLRFPSPEHSEGSSGRRFPRRILRFTRICD